LRNVISFLSTCIKVCNHVRRNLHQFLNLCILANTKIWFFFSYF
jgi:hypothetical protein